MKLEPIVLPKGDGLSLLSTTYTKTGIPVLSMHNPEHIGIVIALRLKKAITREANFRQYG